MANVNLGASRMVEPHLASTVGVILQYAMFVSDLASSGEWKPSYLSAISVEFEIAFDVLDDVDSTTLVGRRGRDQRPSLGCRTDAEHVRENADCDEDLARIPQDFSIGGNKLAKQGN